jgi:hypothetical protein
MVLSASNAVPRSTEYYSDNQCYDERGHRRSNRPNRERESREWMTRRASMKIRGESKSESGETNCKRDVQRIDSRRAVESSVLVAYVSCEGDGADHPGS